MPGSFFLPSTQDEQRKSEACFATFGQAPALAHLILQLQCWILCFISSLTYVYVQRAPHPVNLLAMVRCQSGLPEAVGNFTTGLVLLELRMGPVLLELRMGAVLLELRMGPVLLELRMGPVLLELRMGPVLLELRMGPVLLELRMGPVLLELRMGPVLLELRMGCPVGVKDGCPVLLELRMGAVLLELGAVLL